MRSSQLEPVVTIVETRAGENRDVSLADGSTVSAATLQTAALTTLADMFAVVVPTIANIPDR